MITYVLCSVNGICNSRYWGGVFGVACDGLRFRSTDPLTVCSILHEPDVTSMMLEIKREDPTLTSVPGFARQCDSSTIERTLFGKVIRVESAADA